MAKHVSGFVPSPWSGAHVQPCGEVYLNVAHDPCGLHPAGYVDCVAPDVIMWFPGSNDPSQYPSFVHAWGTQRHKVSTATRQTLCYYLRSYQLPLQNLPPHPSTSLLIM